MTEGTNPYDQATLQVQNGMENLFRTAMLLRLVARHTADPAGHEQVATALDHLIAALQAGMVDITRLKAGEAIELLEADPEEAPTYLCHACGQPTQSCLYNQQTGRARCILCVIDPPEFGYRPAQWTG